VEGGLRWYKIPKADEIDDLNKLSAPKSKDLGHPDIVIDTINKKTGGEPSILISVMKIL